MKGYLPNLSWLPRCCLLLPLLWFPARLDWKPVRFTLPCPLLSLSQLLRTALIWTTCRTLQIQMPGPPHTCEAGSLGEGSGICIWKSFLGPIHTDEVDTPWVIHQIMLILPLKSLKSILLWSISIAPGLVLALIIYLDDRNSFLTHLSCL